MSFILIQTNCQTKRIRRERRRKVDPTISSSTSVVPSTRSSVSSEHQERHQTLVNNGRKKYFDENQQKYVYKQVSQLTTNIYDYETAYKALSSENKYHALNEDMNRYQFDGDLLWTIENAKLLKDSYGDIPEGKRKDRPSLIGFRRPRGFSEPVRSQLFSPQFWNNIYQDIKFLSLSSSLPFYDMLPPSNQNMEFFNTYVNYIISNISILQADHTGLSGSDLETIKPHFFFYFTALQYEDLMRMNQSHQEMYCKQLLYAGHTNLQANRPHQELMNVLLNTIIENIQFARGSNLGQLWKCFLKFVIFEIATNEKISQEFPGANPEAEIDILGDLKSFDNFSIGMRSNSACSGSGTASLAPTMDSTGSRSLDPLSESVDYSKTRMESVSSESINHSIMSSSTQHSHTLNDSSIQLNVNEIIEKPKKGLFNKFRKSR